MDVMCMEPGGLMVSGVPTLRSGLWQMKQATSNCETLGGKRWSIQWLEDTVDEEWSVVGAVWMVWVVGR